VVPFNTPMVTRPTSKARTLVVVSGQAAVWSTKGLRQWSMASTFWAMVVPRATLWAWQEGRGVAKAATVRMQVPLRYCVLDGLHQKRVLVGVGCRQHGV
jgi:hypothetical protein